MKPKFDMRDHPDKLVWKCCTAYEKKTTENPGKRCKWEGLCTLFPTALNNVANVNMYNAYGD